MKVSVEALAELCIGLHGQGYLPSLLNDAHRIEKALVLGNEWLGQNHVAIKALNLGIAVHHGGLPRQFLSEVEGLLNERILPVAISSPTLAQGLDLSCSALVFHSIYRGRTIIPPEEYANVVGRAGRSFVDLDGLTIYPVFENSARRRNDKRQDYERLQLEAQSRQLESGILLLISEIAQRLARRLGRQTNELNEYVLNIEGPWLPTLPTGQEDDRLEALVDDLDTAILATVENLDCSTEELADALDNALRSSLWRRRLEGRSEEEKALQRALLLGRARWLWSRSDSRRRRAFFEAGIGYGAGNFIDENLAPLVAALVRSDGAIGLGDAAVVRQAVLELADRLFSVHPFAFRRPPGWQEILTGWVSGTPLGDLVSATEGRSVEFVQQGIVYHLVWAVEAVRVHALVKEEPDAELLNGATAMVLTFGAPTISTAFLLQAGLPSREMAVRVLGAYPGEFDDSPGLSLWLDGVVADIERRDFWGDSSKTDIWRAFVQRWQETLAATWLRGQNRFGISWTPGVAAPAAGTPVRIIDDSERNATFVCSTDLYPIGMLTERTPEANVGHIAARIGDDSASVVVDRFGPSTRSR